MDTNASPRRVASRYLKSDLVPPLGYPGGPSFVVDRIDAEVTDPRLESLLTEKVSDGEDLSNPEAARIYDVDVEQPPAKTRFKKILIGPHAQYRMDLRGITVPEVRVALSSWNKAFNDGRSRNEPAARRWEEAIMRDESITWTDTKLNLTIAFAAGADRGTIAKIITVYRPGEKA